MARLAELSHTSITLAVEQKLSVDYVCLFPSDLPVNRCAIERGMTFQKAAEARCGTGRRDMCTVEALRS